MNKVKINLNYLVSVMFPLIFLQINIFPGGRYFITFTIIFILFSIFIIYKKIKVDNIDIFYFLLFSFVFILNLDIDPTRSDNILGSMKLVVIFMAFYVAKNISCYKFKHVLINSNITLLLCVLLDFIYRVDQVGFSNLFIILNQNFYLLKIDSLIFSDTNGVGYLLITMSGLNYLFSSTYHTKKSLLIFQVLFYVFIILSFSRGAIVAATLMNALFLFNVMSKYFNKYIKISIYLLFFILISIIAFNEFNEALSVLASDGSGATKLKIYNVLYHKLGDNLYYDLFGYGYKYGAIHFGYSEGQSAHSAIPILLGQIGIIGFLTYALMCLLPLLYNKNYIYLFFGLLIVSFSYLEPYYETLFIALGLSINNNVSNVLFNER